MGRDVVLVSSADETAFAVSGACWASSAWPATTVATSGSTGSCPRATSARSPELGRRLLGPELVDAEGVTWD